MRVCVIGTGYVGLVTGVCLSEIGHNVICVDRDEEKIQKLISGKIPIYEPGLDNLVEKNVNKHNLIFSSNITDSIKSQDILFICVGTPPLPDGSANMKYVEEVSKDIGNNLNGYKVIVNKSTVPIGSGDWVSMIINDNIKNSSYSEKQKSFDVVSNPEFLREGTAISDSFFPDRIVLGSSSTKAIELMKKLYEPIINQKFDLMSISFDPKNSKTVPVVETDLVTAEMIKYAANSFLATKISFINEIANICEKAGADVKMIAYGIGLDSRIGRKFLNSGIGWGGSCFLKDVSALANIAAEYGISTKLLNSVISVNNQQRLKVVQKVQEILKIVKGKAIGVMGIAFKPNTDDTRDAPAITIINNLINLGAKVKAFDPVVKDMPELLNSKVILCKAVEDIFNDSDLVILTTEWEEFKKIDYSKTIKHMKDNNFIDGRNFLDKQKMLDLGYKYTGIGR
jgi:UDPglucose 6-dehydrogenase